jgi:hypothetical protein
MGVGSGIHISAIMRLWITFSLCLAISTGPVGRQVVFADVSQEITGRANPTIRFGISIGGCKFVLTWPSGMIRRQGGWFGFPLQEFHRVRNPFRVQALWATLDTRTHGSSWFIRGPSDERFDQQPIVPEC